MTILKLVNSESIVTVSPEDFDELSKFNWREMNTGYIATGGIENRVGKTPRDNFQLLHRKILGLGKGRVPEVDHKDRNKHNNTRENLRIVSRAENIRNTETNRDIPKGVYLLPSGRYRAMVRHEGKLISIGCYDTVDEAKSARISWEKENWTEMVPLEDRYDDLKGGD